MCRNDRKIKTVVGKGPISNGPQFLNFFVDSSGSKCFFDESRRTVSEMDLKIPFGATHVRVLAGSVDFFCSGLEGGYKARRGIFYQVPEGCSVIVRFFENEKSQFVPIWK